MIITNLKNYTKIDDIIESDLLDITYIKFDDKIKLSYKLIEKIKKMVNLDILDLSDNKYYYRKKYYDYENIIKKCNDIKSCNIFTSNSQKIYNKILTEINGLNLDLENDLILQLEYFMDIELFEKFYSSLYNLPIRIIYFEYVDEFIYNFTNLQILHIKYNQFVIFKSIADICKIIHNNKNLTEFVIDKNKELCFNDFTYATNYNEKNASDDINEEVKNICCYIEDERESMYDFLCVNCDNELLYKQSSKFFRKINRFNFLTREMSEKFFKTKFILNILLLSKIKKIVIYDKNEDEIIKINLLNIINFNDGKLEILNSKYLNFKDLENLPNDVVEIKLDKLNIELSNLPITLEKITVPKKSKIYIKNSKIPFGCKIYYF
jgi:hypothetical protein